MDAGFRQKMADKQVRHDIFLLSFPHKPESNHYFFGCWILASLLTRVEAGRQHDNENASRVRQFSINAIFLMINKLKNIAADFSRRNCYLQLATKKNIFTCKKDYNSFFS